MRALRQSRVQQVNYYFEPGQLIKNLQTGRQSRSMTGLWAQPRPVRAPLPGPPKLARQRNQREPFQNGMQHQLNDLIMPPSNTDAGAAYQSATLQNVLCCTIGPTHSPISVFACVQCKSGGELLPVQIPRLFQHSRYRDFSAPTAAILIQRSVVPSNVTTRK